MQRLIKQKRLLKLVKLCVFCTKASIPYVINHSASLAMFLGSHLTEY